jgi:predicted permease
MERLWQNLRYTFRLLGKTPGFTTVAILSLALGIGANTAIFTLVNALLLRDLPVRQPERLVELSLIRRDGQQVPFSYPMFREIERGQRVFSGLIGWSVGGMFNVEVNTVLSQSRVVEVTGNYYSELGVAPLFGRLLTPDDVLPRSGATSQVAVIGYEFWHLAFGGTIDVVGQQIRIEGQPFTIIGVTRKWFSGMTLGEPPEITIPVTAAPVIHNHAFTLDERSVLWMSITGRLKDGVTTQTPGLRRQAFLSMGLDVSPAATGVARELRARFTKPLFALMGIVSLIVLVACVNLANLMLARAAARSHEMSVRVAIGASRWTLAGQVLTESLALSLAGGLLGLAFAYWGCRLLVTLMTQGFVTPVSLDLNPDLRVLFVTVSVAILTGILFGLVLAWRCSREDPASLLQQSSHNLSGGAGSLSKTLIITQVGLSLVLLVAAGLLARSFQRLRSIDPGFSKENVLETRLSPKPGGYQNLDTNSYHKQLIEQVSSLPAVRSAAFGDVSISGRANEGWREIVSPMSSDLSTGTGQRANAAMVSPGFFQTLGISLIRGRDFEWSDDQGHPRLAIVSSTLAKRLFPHADSFGQHIRFGVMPDLQDMEIVGIANDARIFDLRDASIPVIYLPVLQHPNYTQWGDLFACTSEPPEALAKAVDHEIESLGREYPLQTKTVVQVMSQGLAEERVTAMLSSSFAALALLLASVGLYGLMSYAVTRRTREIGIRVALGAHRENVLWIVLRETLALALLGIAIGIPSALAATRLIASMLFGLSPSDLPTITGVSLLLLVVALLAGYLPARRASSIDPMDALRAE